MNIVVYGLYHLGCVTAACLAASNHVVGLASDPQEIAPLLVGKMPIYEPGLEDLAKAGLKSGKLQFTSDPRCIETCDLLWVCFDTPVDEEDIADTEYVLNHVRSVFPMLREGVIVLVSSQLPVGSIATLENDFRASWPDINVRFACSPENLRLGSAIDVFLKSERIVIGVRDTYTQIKLQPLLEPFCQNLIWISIESAEMTKHALNAFLALSVTYANELARLCEATGAKMSEVESALRAEPRVGRRAYIRPGSAFGGGTLARDVQFLSQLSNRVGENIPVLSHIIESNRIHKNWPIQRLKILLGALNDKNIGLLGLSYKPGTDSIRRSVAIEIAQALLAEKAIVNAFDPQVSQLPETLGSINIMEAVSDVFYGADAVLVTTEWLDFKELPVEDLVKLMREPVILDQNGFLEENLRNIQRLTYLKVGGML
jgi:UDPglucose 6-dehydrogenase